MVKVADFALSRFRIITSSSGNSERKTSSSTIGNSDIKQEAADPSGVTPMLVSVGPNLLKPTNNNSSNLSSSAYTSSATPPMRISPFSPCSGRSRAKSVHASAYIAPESYSGAQCTPQMDIYRYLQNSEAIIISSSLGIILWELTMRVLTGKYFRPFEEHKNLKFDFQVIIQVTKHNLRPTIPMTCPKPLMKLIYACVITLNDSS